MPVFQLPREPVFPPVQLADPSGLLAVGGDLSMPRLVEAYRLGIFPWYGPGEPILWWSPHPRFVLFPDELKVSRSMRQLLKKNLFRVTFDTAFTSVVDACRKPRPGNPETWITPEMREAYRELHQSGLAHSVEVWYGDTLAGGLYGVSLGGCFFGESMFSGMSNTSKIALIALVRRLQKLGFLLVDCQVHTTHLGSLGARFVSRSRFLELLRKGQERETIRGNWGSLMKEQEPGTPIQNGRPASG
ncbi:MAG: leucyl/phenylalanyl-tRNA--protein transferase [Syntrophaceae bacterium]|nr:leucyl/phenylalanyl-tRNA--protein transferase [Syntrophaceae bacterium]